MRIDLSCYGANAAGIHVLVGDFELRSPMDVHAWYRKEWLAIAETIGFTAQLEAALAPQRVVRDRLAATHQAGLAAFAAWLRTQAPSLSDSHAKAQGSVLVELAARDPVELWRVTVDPTALTSGACYQEGRASLRAFYPDTAPGYFGDGWPGPPPRAESACGWQTPLVLHLGTFPWVYSTRLTDPPGLRWSGREAWPALQAMKVMADLMQPSGNLRQDVRQVAAVLDTFVTHTAPLLERLPASDPASTVPGHLERRDGLLRIAGDPQLAVLDGGRGPISALAYNYIIRRFACFFAVRRAALRAFRSLATDVQDSARHSQDPCLQAQVQELDHAR